jgi:hypothetical protein
MFREYSKRHGEVFQRFEAKYFLKEADAMALVSAMRPHVMPDPHTTWGESYWIASLYLDHPGLALYHSSINGERNRFKLRIRSYGDDFDEPVFLETKRRIDKVIQKERVQVHRARLPELLAGFGCDMAALCQPAGDNLDKLWRFREMVETVGAEPCCMVRYLREAYMGACGEPVRISLDRRLVAMPVPVYTPDCWRHSARSHVEVDSPEVILEIKFTDALPQWTCRLIREFELAQRSMAKYVECVRALRGHGMPVGRGIRKMTAHELL